MKVYQYDEEQKDQMLNEVFHLIVNCLSQEQYITASQAKEIKRNYVYKQTPLSWFGELRQKIWPSSKGDENMGCLLKVVRNYEIEETER